MSKSNDVVVLTAGLGGVGKEEEEEGEEGGNGRGAGPIIGLLVLGECRGSGG